jgi:hypothetical protein
MDRYQQMAHSQAKSQNAQRFDAAFRHIPEPVISASPHEFGALCLEAVTRNDLCFQYIPERLKTPELYLEAVKRNGSALEYVPWGSVERRVGAVGGLWRRARR